MGVRPFIDFLRDQRGGETQEELARKLNELVAAVERVGKRGSLTLTIEVAPISKELAGQLLVSDSVTLKLPQPKRGATMFFSTPENNLSRRDPRQIELPGLKAVERSEAEPTEVGHAG
jgi:hypothetical protein